MSMMGSLAGPEFTAKVNRVLDAARAWRAAWLDSTIGYGSNDTKELVAAIDALGAPRERWSVSSDGVTDGKYVIQLWANGSMDEICAMREHIARALNAADAREGKA